MKTEKFNISKILIENRWVWHCCFWIFYLLYISRNYTVTVLYYPDYLNFMLVSDLFFIAFVYSILFFYRQLVSRNRYFLFLGMGTLLWVTFVVIRSSLMKVMMQSIPEVANRKLGEIILTNLPIYFLFYIFVVVFKYLKDNFIAQYQQNQQQKLQLHVELENLKAQISPHFLFNTMNNFYGLAVENSKKLPDLMIRLSDLLRYSLYETQQEKVPLQDEIDYLKNYIELEKIRLESNLDLKFIVNVENAEQYQIGPLLLITFIENAFKHARNIVDEPVFIAITIVVSDDGVLQLTVKNNYNANAQNCFTNEKRIGLENARKRLSAIYPDEKHVLSFNQDEMFHSVALSIYLK
ncbi:MAG TPA: histidine kinase [Chitinophagales bacterium]|nr:histidine kinase [Chitinophagales bacterium]